MFRKAFEAIPHNADAILKLDPDGNHIRLLTLTTKGQEDGVDFYSRVVCPFYGIPEDPVTGQSLIYRLGQKLGYPTPDQTSFSTE